MIQINPKAREDEPKTVAEIADRRNELSGNLSLHQEIHFIEKINELREQGVIRDARYKNITVRRIELSRRLDTASKLNRDPSFIRGLVAHGEERAAEFLAPLAFEDAWRARDPDGVMGFFAEDATLSSSPRSRTAAYWRKDERCGLLSWISCQRTSGSMPRSSRLRGTA